ncbi:MAG: branched-chain amino acid transport system II carrier protein, partial [Clostridium celatum]|nr:branched-chain amino acid transport system II carrier protein [Clostridium celatum]
MKNLSKKDLLLVSLMLFSLFFGAGNLIFPPFLGQSAGNKTWVAMAGFLITAVGFPILGVVAVAKSNGLYNLAKKVNPIFALIFTTLIYLSIGPGLGIPRAGSLPFEM